MATPVEIVSGWFRSIFNANRPPAPYQNPSFSMNPYNKGYYDAFLQYLGWDGYTSYDVERPKYVHDGYMRNADVYAVINQIANKASSVPFSLLERQSPARAQKMRTAAPSLLSGGAREHLQYKMMQSQAYGDEPLKLPLDRPNPHQTWPEFVALSEVFWNACGEVFYYWEAPEKGARAGIPARIFILPSHLVQIKVKKEWSEEGVIDDPVDYYCIINQERIYKFDKERVIHTTMPNPYFDFHGRHLYGLSPLMPVWQEILAGNEGNANNLRMQRSGGAIGFIYGKKDILEDEQAKQLRDRITEMRSDPTAMAQIAGITMEIGFQRVALDVNEIGMYENQKYVQKKICNALGWSDKLLNNDEGAKYDNMNQAYKAAITNKIMPDLYTLAEALNDKFWPLFGREYANAEMVFHYDQLAEMQEDIVEQSKWVLPLIKDGVMTRSEGRAIMGLENIEDPALDIFTTQMNVIPLADAIAPNLDDEIDGAEGADI